MIRDSGKTLVVAVLMGIGLGIALRLATKPAPAPWRVAAIRPAAVAPPQRIDPQLARIVAETAARAAALQAKALVEQRRVGTRPGATTVSDVVAAMAYTSAQSGDVRIVEPAGGHDLPVSNTRKPNNQRRTSDSGAQ